MSDETIKNRGLFPVGTRVVGYAKLPGRGGEVVEVDEKRERMAVLWDGERTPFGGYMAVELREEKK